MGVFQRRTKGCRTLTLHYALRQNDITAFSSAWTLASPSCVAAAGWKTLQRYRRQFTVPRIGVMKDNSLRYRASKHDCGLCPLKPRCCPNELARKDTLAGIHSGAAAASRSTI